MDEENKIEQKIEDENKKEEVSSTVLKTQGITTEENVSVEDYNVSNSREVASENEATTKEEISNENDLMSKSYEDIKENYKEEFNNTSDEFKLEYKENLENSLKDEQQNYENVSDKYTQGEEDVSRNFYNDEEQNQNKISERIDELYEQYKEEPEILENKINEDKELNDLYIEKSSYTEETLMADIEAYREDNEHLSTKMEIHQDNISNLENQLENLKQDYPDIAETYEQNKENETKEVSSENNVSNEAQQEQKIEEGFLSSMIGENDFLADNRNSEYAFDQAFTQFADDFDAGNSVLKTGFQDIENFVNGIKDKLENEENRISNNFNNETTSEQVVENKEPEAVSNTETKEEISINQEQEAKLSLNELEEKLANINEQIANVSNEEVIDYSNKLEITPEMREEQKVSEALAREGQKGNDTEYAYSPDSETESNKVGELFEKRDELMEQLENPKDGTYEIEKQLESVNEQISQLSTDDLRDYNNSLSSEITQEQREEQKVSEELSREGQKDNNTEYGKFEYKEEVETSLNKEDLTNQLEKETLNSENNVSNETEKNLDVGSLVEERDNLKEQINEMKTEVSNDVESSADNLKMELAKEEFTEFAEKNLPENEREEFVNVMLEVNADSIKSQETIEGVEKEINSSLESYQEVKAEIESEKSSETEKNMDSNVSSKKETEQEAGASR